MLATWLQLVGEAGWYAVLWMCISGWFVHFWQYFKTVFMPVVLKNYSNKYM
jgi:hypothetical protein